MKTSEFKVLLTKSIVGIVKQGKRCNVHNVCRYQYREAKCIIGHMMTTSELALHKPRVTPVTQLHLEGYLPTITTNQLNILASMQGIHDDNLSTGTKFTKELISELRSMNNGTINAILKEQKL
jgi:hypothetical protein